MKNYKFGLNEECFLIKGAKRGAIYDLKSGDVYSINETAKKVLDECEQGLSLRKVVQDISELSSEEISKYLSQLESLKLGRFLKKKEIIKKISLECPSSELNFIWLEVTRRCNLNCLHCYARSGTVQTGRNELGIRDWERLTREAFDLGCRRIQLIGGEPLLFGKDILVIIELARKLGYEIIEVFSNATLFTDEYIDFFSQYDVQVAISIYSKRPEIHDSITQVRGSFEQTIGNVKKLRAKGVKIRFATIVLRQNEIYLSETLDFFTGMGELQTTKCFDIVRPVGRGDSYGLLPERLKLWQHKRSPVFPKITKNAFLRRKYGHSCWPGSVAVTANGDVIPCIMARKMKCGNITKHPLREIIGGKNLQELWRLSKDKIQKCRDCEYRYLCIDCRPSIKGNIDNPDRFCTYDPYKGQWSELRQVSQLIGRR